MKLRDYQCDIVAQLKISTSNDLVQLDTGAGKTPVEAALAEWAPHCLLVAHRNILITQISEKLAAFGLAHDTISTEHTRRRCMAMHRIHGRNYIERGHPARRAVSIDSLLAHHKRLRLEIDTALPWLIIIDEAHHIINDNKWGRLRQLFPNARIVGFTATPARMDGESLHVTKGGIFDRLVQASTLTADSTRTLIGRGYLSDFRAYAGKIGKNYVNDGRRLALYGDPIAEYKRLAAGKQAIMMCPAILNAEEFAEQFRAAGVPAACINSSQTQNTIARLLDAFAAGRIRVLTNVDMVGEGFDLPAVEVLIIAARTTSFPRYRQWAGRVLRPSAGKVHAIIIDLTGMVAEHGMPDEHVAWDLIDPPVGLKSIRTAPCGECGMYYPVKLRACPECGVANALHERESIGGFYFDIKRIDSVLLAQARKEIRLEKQDTRQRTEIIWPTHFDGGDLVGRSITGLRRWFVDQLQSASVPIIDINVFLLSKESKGKEFWMTQFTIADAKTKTSTKAKKVYTEWSRKSL